MPDPSPKQGGDASSRRARRSQLSRRDAMVLGGIIAGGGLTSVWLQSSAPLARDVSRNRAAREALTATSSRSDGNPSGDVRLVAFNDFLCPFCKLTAPELANAVRADGNVRVEYVDLALFGPVAEEAARLGLAMALQGKYAQFHHAVMNARQGTDRALLRDAVRWIGASWRQAQLDLEGNENEFTVTLKTDALLAFALGINGTPAFLIGGLLAIGRLGEDQFQGLFDQARKLAS